MVPPDDNLMEELITESREHLENIEPDLLAMEQSPESLDAELVNRVFRAMHSIKGGFGFFGMTNIQNLSHSMENVLMRVRDGEMQVDAAIVDSLLAGVDKLRAMIDDVGASQEMSIEEEMAPLRDILEGKAPEAKAQAPDTPPSGADPGDEQQEQGATTTDIVKERGYKISSETVKGAAQNGKTIYDIAIWAADLAESGRTLASLMGELADLGEVLDGSRPLDEICAMDKAPEADAPLAILYATVIEPDLIGDLISLPSERIRHLDTASLAESLGMGAPKMKSTETPTEAPAEAEKAASAVSGPAAKAAETTESIRVRLDLLNKLMNLAGELVLGRNQIKQALSAKLVSSCDAHSSFKHIEMALARTRQNICDALNYAAGKERGNGGAEDMGEVVRRELESLRASFLQALDFSLIDLPGLAAVVQNVDLVTSEIQGNIMNTRMQAVGTVFSKFPRIIRDLARNLHKEIELTIEGQDVELDKSIIEALGDPLTHLIRNSADHGIEEPDAREAAGKSRRGQIELRAYHESGQVNIDIVDDGAGIDAAKLRRKVVDKGLMSESAAAELSEREALALIFMPGLSTVEQVSDLSGRGVGMDVVKTNIEKLGGVVEIESTLGKGTRINLKLPLTLAIIPSLIVTTEDRVFAVPQVNLEELVRIRASEQASRILSVQGRPVLRLREKLLPLVRLTDVLNLGRTFVAPDGDRKPDRRETLVDRRAPDLARREAAEAEAPEVRQDDSDRRRASRNAINIVVLKVGPNHYGLIVDKLLDNEEIVVKPLSAFLKNCRCYAGATIMGDGSVAMILDAVGIAEAAELRFGGDLERAEAQQADDYLRRSMTEAQSLLLFRNGTDELFAMNLDLVARVEKIRASAVERVGEKEYLKYESHSLRILRLHDFLPIARPESLPEEFFVIVPKLVLHPMGIVVTRLEDIVEVSAEVDRRTITGAGIMGSVVMDGRLAIMLDIYSLFEAAEPEIYDAREKARRLIEGARVLLAEDTAFFRVVEQEYLESLGCKVEAVNDGAEAWERLQKEPYDLLVTDVVMPRMNGVELVEHVRASERLMEMPVVALTSLMSESDRSRVMKAGVNSYEIKLDKDHLRQTLEDLLEGRN